jgi:8-hydroxy-5-deazaflavin:NADPH oxidoreductase
MSTAVIGTGKIGSALAEHLVAGGEPVVLAASERPDALAKQLGDLASTAPVGEAIKTADVVIFAVWLEIMKDLINENLPGLDGKVVVDTSNPVAADAKGEFHRTLPDGVSSGSVVASLVPKSAHFVKAFGSLSAESLRDGANRSPRRAVLFYTSDDARAQTAIEQLISAAGFDPVRAGGVDAAIRI